VFISFFAHRGPTSPGWMMPTAYAALGVFTAALIFLVFAMRRPEATVAFCLKLTLLPRLAPRLSAVMERKLLDLIRGFAALKDVRNLSLFMLWSLVYWVCDGLGVWTLAHAFGLDLSVVGAFATMGLLGVGISLPNSPGLVGQFQWFTLMGLSLYLGFDLGDPATKHTALYASALTFAIAQHLIQVAWYVTMGALGLASPWVSFHDLWNARKGAADDKQAAPVRSEPSRAPAESGGGSHARAKKPAHESHTDRAAIAPDGS
jgi:glycosyltransferase 2 family protein